MGRREAEVEEDDEGVEWDGLWEEEEEEGGRGEEEREGKGWMSGVGVRFCEVWGVRFWWKGCEDGGRGNSDEVCDV